MKLIKSIVEDSVQDEHTTELKYDRALPSKNLEAVVEHEPELGQLEFSLEYVFLMLIVHYGVSQNIIN
jgi:hypothetical protein